LNQNTKVFEGLHSEGITDTSLLHISRVHATQVQKVLVLKFNYDGWMNAFCPTVCCIYVQLNIQCC